MKLATLLLFCATLSAASIFIDCGSPSDNSFTGGIAFGPFNPNLTDSTLRFSSQPFSYKIPTDAAGLYAVTLTFVESSVTGPGQRLFNVRANDATALDRLDIFAVAGFQKPLLRSFLVYSDGLIQLDFVTVLRSAVVSSIHVEPFAVVSYIKLQEPKRFEVLDAVAYKGPGFDAWVVPRPFIESDPTVPLLYQNIRVWKNYARVQARVGDAGGNIAVNPVEGETWTPGVDAITVDYTAIWPL